MSHIEEKIVSNKILLYTRAIATATYRFMVKHLRLICEFAPLFSEIMKHKTEEKCKTGI
ncbi:MAG TPA: hypothetical protein PK496_08515 [Bacteroidales bacterium]|jgi:hypothetical protein|nr:hypothetical protein [Bacteroidales bacterium]HQG75841.1 hypothetical protein [Bacteroidales bacterium]